MNSPPSQTARAARWLLGGCLWYEQTVRRAIAFSLLLYAQVAHAGEGEKVLSLVPEFSTWSTTQGPASNSNHTIDATGGALGVDFERGYNDTLWLRGSAAGGAYQGPDGLAWSGGATVGITYALDVLRYVPYINLGIGALVVGGGGVDTALKPVVELGVGFDVLESRTFSWGVVIRFDAFASQAQFFTIGPRISWRWGFF